MPMLEQHEVAAYLLARRLISRRSIVSGRLRVADVSSRNRNFRVSAGSGESYLVKQGLAPDSAHTLANEAALYRRLAPVAAWIPRLLVEDAERELLVLEWIDGGEALDRRGRCSAAQAAALGRVLAGLHAIAPDDEELRRDAPWVLALHRPPLDAVRYLSGASAELVAALQRDAAACRALDELDEGWSADALVHRDVKWANCVAHGGAIALVDWEMAGWGDPATDVGSALGEFAGRSPVAGAFWRAYAGARRLDAFAATELLERALRHAGARLLQTAYEHAQEIPSLDARAADGLGAARDLLVSPRDAAARRLGIAA
jgi:aminoglycoside phosphotransferase (APT) family kinase protein